MEDDVAVLFLDDFLATGGAAKDGEDDDEDDDSASLMVNVVSARDRWSNTSPLSESDSEWKFLFLLVGQILNFYLKLQDF